MPIVGQLSNGFDPRKLIGVGLAVGGWTMFALSRLNLNAGYWNIFRPQVIQGARHGVSLHTPHGGQHGGDSA